MRYDQEKVQVTNAFFSTRVPDLRGQIQPAYRSAIDKQPLEQLLKHFLDSCPADSLVLIDQPGISSEDFKLTPSTASLWTQFARYFHRCGTFIPYLQTQVSLSQKKLADYYVRNCEAEVIKADLSKSNPEHKLYPHFGDTRRRVITVKLPPLSTDPEERQDELFNNDLLIHELVSGIPSPFFAIIYTNSEGANTTQPPGLFSEYFIIDELVRSSRKPEIRDQWKKNAPLEEGQFLGDLGEVKPPLMEHKKRLEKKRQDEEYVQSKKVRMEAGSSVDKLVEKLDALLTVESVLLVLLISIFSWVVWFTCKILVQIFNGIRGALPTASQPEGKPQVNNNETAEKDSKTKAKTAETVESRIPENIDVKQAEEPTTLRRRKQ